MSQPPPTPQRIDSFRTIAEVMPQLVWTTTAEGTVDYFNARWIEYTGLTVAARNRNGQVPGVVHPDEADQTRVKWLAALRTGKPFEIEYRLRNASDGSYRWFLGRAVPIAGDDGTVVQWVGTATDIDDQKRARDSLSFVVEAGNVLSSSLDVESICKALVDVTIGHFADWCSVVLLREGRLESLAIGHRNPQLLADARRHVERYGISPNDRIAHAIAANQPLLMAQITEALLTQSARDEEHLALLHRLAPRSAMVVPLSTPAGKVYGALNMASAESGRVFAQADLNVAMAVARRAAVAIENATILSQERETSHRLRFSARVNQLLFEASNLWKTMEGIASMIAADIADACEVVQLRNDALRTEVFVHREPKLGAALATTTGQRTRRIEAERESILRLQRHEVIVRDPDDAAQMKERLWPYFAAEVDVLDPQASVVVPLYSRSKTYGALVAYFSLRRFDPKRDLPVLQELATGASLALERAETFERERRIATTLQQASLPSLLPHPPGVTFDTVYLPAGDEAEVGGDWYDAIELDDGRVVISVGDVTGRGIQAAAIMSKVRHAMGMSPLHESNPAKILDSAGWFLGKRYPDAIVTAFAGIISADRTTLQFASAGHPPALLRRDDAVSELYVSGLPLGLRGLASDDQTATSEVRDGDIVVLYTDGLTEGERDIVKGEARLAEVVGSRAVAATTMPARLIQDACLPYKVHDDVAILVVRFGRPPAWSFSAEDSRAATVARQQFVEYLRNDGYDADFQARAELVFGELLGNVVRHAPGPVEIVFYSDECSLHVIDSGPEFAVENRLPKDILSELGRGMYIIQQLVRSVDLEHIPHYGNHITVSF